MMALLATIKSSIVRGKSTSFGTDISARPPDPASRPAAPGDSPGATCAGRWVEARAISKAAARQLDAAAAMPLNPLLMSIRVSSVVLSCFRPKIR